MRKAEEKKEDKGQEVTIEEEVRIPDTDIILEKGDRIKVHSKVQEEKSLDSIMKKVGKGDELDSEEEKLLKAALDAAKGKDADEDMVDKVMDKVRNGKELTKDEEEILSMAMDAEKGKKD